MKDMIEVTDYNRIFENILEENRKRFVKRKPSILLHSCCGPCSSYVINTLMNFFNVYIFFYNPNIYPEEEYIKRRKEQLRLLSFNEFKSVGFIDIIYSHKDFLEKVYGYEKDFEGGERCSICFKMRLEKTAKMAKKLNLDYFSTTLTVSPHKNAKQINAIGEYLSKKFSLDFLFSDFKKKDGYKKSIELSKKYNLYRQNYCGCEFSLKNNSTLYKKH